VLDHVPVLGVVFVVVRWHRCTGGDDEGDERE